MKLNIKTITIILNDSLESRSFACIYSFHGPEHTKVFILADR